MSRAVEEWQGKTPDTAIPVRVQLRVFERAGGKCEHCSRKIMGRSDWQCDHKLALILGGQNRENNLQALCVWCHAPKSRDDVALKSKAARVRAKHLGIHKPKGRPMPGTKASGMRKRMSGEVERW